MRKLSITRIYPLLFGTLLCLLSGALGGQTVHLLLAHEQEQDPMLPYIRMELKHLARTAQMDFQYVDLPLSGLRNKSAFNAELYSRQFAGNDIVFFYYYGTTEYDNENLLEDFPYFRLTNGERIFQSEIHQLLQSKGAQLVVTIADGQNERTGSFAELSKSYPYDPDKVKQLLSKPGDVQIVGYSRFQTSNYHPKKGSVFGHAFFNAFHILCNKDEKQEVSWANLLACTKFNMKQAVRASGKAQEPYSLIQILGGQSWDSEEQISGYKTDGIDYAYQIPMFPFPPPRASSRTTLGRSYFRSLETLGDVDTELNQAISACGYFEKSYFAVPGGFALVTRLEQTNEDGTPKQDPDRWSSDIGPLEDFSLAKFLSALFYGQVGYFRIFVFIVTDQPFSTTGSTPNQETAEQWLSDGLNKLPDAIKGVPFSEQTNCTILVYEFEKKESGEGTFVQPGRLSIQTHLDKSKILTFLER